jgi:hypothetical protein
MASVATVHTMLGITEYRLRLGRPLIPAEATQLRGFFGRAYSNEVLLHHHQGDGQFLYHYPRVQFKVLDSAACLLGIEQGGDIVERLWREVDAARIGHDNLPVLEDLYSRGANSSENPSSPSTIVFVRLGSR